VNQNSCLAMGNYEEAWGGGGGGVEGAISMAIEGRRKKVWLTKVEESRKKHVEYFAWNLGNNTYHFSLWEKLKKDERATILGGTIGEHDTKVFGTWSLNSLDIELE
jgi:hypothetical protein